MKPFALILGLLALSVAYPDSISSQETSGTILVTNNGDATVSYRYRAIYNDGKGSDRRYFSVQHKAGGSYSLAAAGVPDYGIVLRIPSDQARWGRKLYAQLGPYQLRANGDIHDAKGRKVPTIMVSD